MILTCINADSVNHSELQKLNSLTILVTTSPFEFFSSSTRHSFGEILETMKIIDDTAR